MAMANPSSQAAQSVPLPRKAGGHESTSTASNSATERTPLWSTTTTNNNNHKSASTNLSNNTEQGCCGRGLAAGTGCCQGTGNYGSMADPSPQRHSQNQTSNQTQVCNSSPCCKSDPTVQCSMQRSDSDRPCSHLLPPGSLCCKDLLKRSSSHADSTNDGANNGASSKGSSSLANLILGKIDPDTVRDVIIGLSDGLTVPFALTAGLSGVGSTRLVVVAGVAELVSGAISMGVGGFLSAQAEMQHYAFTKQRTRAKVALSCNIAVEEQVAEILGPYGVPKEVAALVADKLVMAENREVVVVGNGNGGSAIGNQDLESNQTPSSRAAKDATDKDDDDNEVGLTPFLLRLSHGLDRPDSNRALTSATTIGASYFFGGLLPLLPYILLSRFSPSTSIKVALAASTAVTAAMLILLGLGKWWWLNNGENEPLEGDVDGAVDFTVAGGRQDQQRNSRRQKRKAWKGYARSAIETLLVGGMAALASWVIVRWMDGPGGGEGI